MFSLILGLTFTAQATNNLASLPPIYVGDFSSASGAIESLKSWVDHTQSHIDGKTFETPGYPFCSYLANIYGPIPDYQEGYRHANSEQKAQLRQLDQKLMGLLLQVKSTYFPNETCAGSGFDSKIRLFFPAQ